MNVQPISTAPRDGTVIRLCSIVDGQGVIIINGHWNGHFWVVEDGIWTEANDCGPTHWGENV